MATIFFTSISSTSSRSPSTACRRISGQLCNVLRITRQLRNLSTAPVAPPSPVEAYQSSESSKTVAVLGAAYAGFRAAHTLQCNLPPDWRVVVLERNTHFNHVYVFPRLIAQQGHEHKAFIPFSALFDVRGFIAGGGAEPSILPFSSGVPSSPNPNHKLIHSKVESISLPNNTIKYQLLESGKEGFLKYDYLVYALGSQLPQPINTWAAGGTGVKKESVAWMKRMGDLVKNANAPDKDSDVLVIGGGALGVQFASDIKDLYPQKRVILVHSRPHLLNRFNPWMHEHGKKALEDMGIEVITGERVIAEEDDHHTYQTTSGRKITTALVLKCTGQTPETSFLPEETLDPITREAYVTRSLQLAQKTGDGQLEEYGKGNVFVVGDSAQAFGARKAGNTAFFQAQLAASNIARLIYNQSNPTNLQRLENYIAPPLRIKVSLGRKHAIYQNAGGNGHRGPEEMKELQGADAMWRNRGCGDLDRHT
ncbi:FAD/NAD(P)-binding domain-containing protein [Atractiella rhizophila]|nr:FAD/NAD(P)-binding domain-containing protein [Atractiella rhizophila]